MKDKIIQVMTVTHMEEQCSGDYLRCDNIWGLSESGRLYQLEFGNWRMRNKSPIIAEEEE